MTVQEARQQLEGRGGGFVYPGQNWAVGGAGPGQGQWSKTSGDSMGEGECGRGGLGLLWAVGGSAGLAAWNPGSRPGI